MVAYLAIPHPHGAWLLGRGSLHISRMADEVTEARSTNEGNATRCEVGAREVSEIFRSFILDRTVGLRLCSDS